MIHFLTQTGLLAGSKNLIGGLLFGASTFLASGPEAPKKPTSFDASVYINQSGKIRLAVQKSAPTGVSVQLLDQKNQVLYSHYVTKKQLKTAMVLDVSQIEDGMYTLEIKSDEGSILKQVSVTTSTQKRTIQFD